MTNDEFYSLLCEGCGLPIGQCDSLVNVWERRDRPSQGWCHTKCYIEKIRQRPEDNRAFKEWIYS